MVELKWDKNANQLRAQVQAGLPAQVGQQRVRALLGDDLRPAYTMGGAGGGLVYNKDELRTVCARGLQASLVG